MDPPTVVETAYGTLQGYFTYKNLKRYFAAPLPVAAFEEPAVRAAWSSTHGGDQRCERRRWADVTARWQSR